MRTRTTSGGAPAPAAPTRVATTAVAPDSLSVISDAFDPNSVADALQGSPARGTVVRGGASASGDSARNHGGATLALGGRLAAARPLHIDWENRTLTVAAGAKLGEVIPELLRQGWFLPVTPDTSSATVGGCIATDAHGRNHLASGSFGSQVRALTLVDGSGRSRHLTPGDTDPAAFWSTIGGLGLHGVVTGAVLDVEPVSTAWVVVDSQRCDGIDEVMAHLDHDSPLPHRIARLDPTAPGSGVGRGVVFSARHASVDELPAARRGAALEFEFAPMAAPLRLIPGKLLGPRTLRAFHEAWFRMAPRERRDQLQPIAEHLYADDARTDLADWYEAANVVRYQFVVPDSACDLIVVALERFSETGVPPIRAQLRRFGPGNLSPLSFATSGWALDLHVAIATPDVAWILDALDEQVASAGGRVDLAKDDRLRPELVSTMYPRLAQWRQIRQDLDPDRRLRSDLARRLNL